MLRKIAKKLSREERRNLPASSFAVSKRMAKQEEPKKHEPPRGEKGKYPMPDKGHARMALYLVSIHGTPAEKEAVRRKAAHRFGIGTKSDNKPKKTAALNREFDMYLDTVAAKIAGKGTTNGSQKSSKFDNLLNKLRELYNGKR